MYFICLQRYTRKVFRLCLICSWPAKQEPLRLCWVLALSRLPSSWLTADSRERVVLTERCEMHPANVHPASHAVQKAASHRHMWVPNLQDCFLDKSQIWSKAWRCSKHALWVWKNFTKHTKSGKTAITTKRRGLLCFLIHYSYCT